jgi:hypothetical protein
VTTPTLSTRARALGALLLVVLAVAACTPQQKAAVAAHIQRSQAEAQLIASRTTGGPSDATLYRLRMCESGGNYRAVSASGAYRGAYQFSRGTWNSVARGFLPRYDGVDPAAAPPYIQDAMTRALWKQQGSSPWPHCGPRAA